MRTSLGTACAVVLVTGCTGSTMAVQQNGLIPRPRADTYDGQPMPHTFEAEGYASTAPIQPTAGNDPMNGATIARTDFGGAIRVAVGQDAELGAHFDVALANGGVETGPNPIAPPVGSSWGIGATMRRSFPIAGEGGDPNGVRIGLSATLTAWTIERREEEDREASDLSAVGSVAIVPSKRFGNIVAFGSVTLMNQISSPATFVVGTGTEQNQSTSPTTVAGGGAAVLAIGARVDLGENVSVVFEAAEPISTYGQDVPIIGASLILGTGPRPDLRPHPVAPGPPAPIPYSGPGA